MDLQRLLARLLLQRVLRGAVQQALLSEEPRDLVRRGSPVSVDEIDDLFRSDTDSGRCRVSRCRIQLRIDATHEIDESTDRNTS
ncbi:hypothetical protein N505_0126100 [Rhodococcus aetherivorans]|nr:hypothetical protein N505_0126100 [Rhodococcus aetherivorans]